MCWVDLSMVTTTLAAAGTVPISKANNNGTSRRIAALPVMLRVKLPPIYARPVRWLRRTVNDIKQAGELLRGFGRGDVFELEGVLKGLLEAADLADLQPGLGIELVARALRDRARDLHVLGEAVDRARVAVR